MTTWNDRQLLEALKNSDRQAFKLIYERYWDTVYDAAVSRVKDREVCEDLIQELFVNLWEKRAYLKIDDLPSYLCGAVKNNIKKLHRRELVRKRFVSEQAYKPAYAAPTDEPVILKELSAALQTLASRLTKNSHHIFRLRFEDGLMTDDIAGRLNLSKKTVQNQVSMFTKQIYSLLS